MLYIAFIASISQTIENLEERVKQANIEIAVRTSFLTDPTNAVRNLKVNEPYIFINPVSLIVVGMALPLTKHQSMNIDWMLFT